MDIPIAKATILYIINSVVDPKNILKTVRFLAPIHFETHGQ